MERANLIANGQFLMEPAALEDSASISTYKYPPGQALLLAPLLKVHPRAIYLLNPILLTLMTLVLTAILRHSKLPDYIALLLLFHPGIVLFSRTIMSDVPAAFCFLIALWLIHYRQKGLFWAGLALGYSVSLRVAIVPMAGIGMLYSFWQYRNNGYRLVAMLSGFLIGALPFLSFLLQNNLFSANAYGHDIQHISFQSYFYIATQHLMTLNLIYPGMLVIGLISSFPGRKIILGLSIAAVTIFSLFSATKPTSEGIMGLVVNQRYFLFLIPMLVIGYGVLLHRWILHRRILLTAALILLVVGNGFIANKHQGILDRNYAFHRIIYENTTDNSLLVIDDQSAEMIQNLYGPRRILNVEIIKKPDLVKEHIHSVRSKEGDVFVILLNREEDRLDSEMAMLFQKLLASFSHKEVLSHTADWELTIFKLTE